MSEYLLAQHVHLCLTRDYAILLDLKADRYFALSGPQLNVLSRIVRGWPVREEGYARVAVLPSDESRPGTTADSLIEKGLLTTDRRVGKEATPVSVELPASTLIDTILTHTLLADPVCDRPVIHLRDIGKFAAAYAAAASALRWRSIEETVRGVRSRKQSSVARAAGFEFAAARDRVWIFRVLRPFFFASHQRCLLQSLALIEFLARYGSFPTWVFGVASGPFAAHCWVQEQTVVFNDTPEHVRRYTPIMAV